MCFTKVKAHDKGIVAEKNIDCYKVLYYQFRNQKSNIRLFSPYQHFEYEKGKVYSLNTNFRAHNKDVNRGLHSYRKLERAENWNNYNNLDIVIVKCIIPKGAAYLKNKHEFVSNALKVTKIVHIFKNGRGTSEELNKKYFKI